MLAHIENVHINFNQRTSGLAAALIAGIAAKAAESAPAGPASSSPEPVAPSVPPKIGEVWPGMGVHGPAGSSAFCSTQSGEAVQLTVTYPSLGRTAIARCGPVAQETLKSWVQLV